MSLLRLSERRANIENPAVPLTSNTLLSLFGGQQTDSGIPVTEYTAVKMSAVYRGASLISGLCGALPINVYKIGTKESQPNTLLADPHPEMTPLEFWRLCGFVRVLWGNFYAQKIRNVAGGIVWMNPIHPSRVAVLKARSIDANPTGKIFKVTDDNGHITPMTSNEIFHVPGLGYDGLQGFSPVRLAAQSIGLSLALEKYGANLFGRGNLLSGLLQTDSKLNQDQAEALQQRWSEKFSGQDGAHRVAVLDAGAKFQSLTMPNDDAEMLASRDFQVTEIARFMGIPPYLMYQTDKTTSWGCIPGDVLVFTTVGPKPIEDVVPGDEVWSFNDAQGLVIGKVTDWRMTGYKPLLTVRTQSRELRLTANHVVPVRRRFGIAEGRKPGNCTWETVEVRADQIRPGDYLLVPNKMPNAARTMAPNGRELTVRAMELCGLYTGDGNADKNRVEIAHAVDDPHMPYYLESVRREFGVEPYTDPRGIRSRFSSAAARELLECGFTGKAHTKRVPGWVFRLSQELRLAFLRGYLDADGGIARGVVSFASCNPELLEDVRHLCMSVGVPAGRVHLSRRAGVGYIKGRQHQSRDKYVLNLSMTSENHKIGSNHPAKLANLRTEPMQRVLRSADGWEGGLGSTKRVKRPEATPGGTWRHRNITLHRVVSVDTGTVEVPVYDISVSDHEHFIADGVIVHNSGLEQQARGFNQFDLHPNWLAPTEQRITKELLPRGKEARYDIDQLLRGDSEARAKFYAVMREAGALSSNEIRFKEDMPPRAGGDTYIDPAPAIMENSPMGSDPNLRD